MTASASARRGMLTVCENLKKMEIDEQIWTKKERKTAKQNGTKTSLREAAKIFLKQ